MRIALLYDPFLLSARGTLDLDGYRDDPRGMTGSEQCAVRLFEEFRDAGHSPILFTNSSAYVRGMSGSVERWDERGNWHCDIAISINCPDGLRDTQAGFKVTYALLNDWTFAKVGFEEHVDLFFSPSESHLDQVMHNSDWRRVELDWEHPNGKAQYVPDPDKWRVCHLGCDPERFQGFAKVPGRVIHCSSPDRGLHWLLQSWPSIKRAVPHANLRIFYRLQPWIESMKAQIQPDGSVFPPVMANVERALYVDEALRRMSDPKWGITVCDSVSRAQIEREMAEAQCVAYPLDPLNSYTEGFSCSTLEACAARACPITTNADAFGGLYGSVLPLVERAGDWVPVWRDHVIRALTDEKWREEVNDRAERLAQEKTWTATASKLMQEIQKRL